MFNLKLINEQSINQLLDCQIITGKKP